MIILTEAEFHAARQRRKWIVPIAVNFAGYICVQASPKLSRPPTRHEIVSLWSSFIASKPTLAILFPIISGKELSLSGL
jgi:hypothetical protein